jgi:MFS family permease
MSRASDATETEPLLGLRDDDVQSNQETTEIDWMSLASLTAIFALYVFSSSVLSISTWLLIINACDGTDWSDIDEGWCKTHTIQRHVGTLMGWNMGLQAIPVLTTAVWYGSLADKFGRKPILFAAVAGEFASGAWILLVCRLFEL